VIRRISLFSLIIAMPFGFSAVCGAQGGFIGLPLGIDLPNTSGADYGYVRIADDDAIEPQTLTLEAWIHPLGNGYGQTHQLGSAILAKPMEGLSGSRLGSWFMFWAPPSTGGDSGKIIVSVNDQLGVSGTAMWSTGTVPINTTAHVALTFDGTWLRIFLNGQLDSEVQTSAANVDYGDQDVLIGAANFGNGYYYRFDGIIDEVRIWDYARSEGEIGGQMGCALSGDEPGLLAYYSFNLGDVADDSGNGHDGVIEGPPPPDGPMFEEMAQDCMILFDGFDSGDLSGW